MTLMLMMYSILNSVARLFT